MYPSKLLQNNFFKVCWSNNGFLYFRLQKIRKKLWASPSYVLSFSVLWQRACKFLKVFKQEGIFKLWSWKAFSESYDCASSIKIQVRYLISIIGKLKNFLSVVITFTDKCHLKRNVDFMIMTWTPEQQLHQFSLLHKYKD